MAWNLQHVEAEFARVNDEIASENLVRTLITTASNTNPYALAIQDAKLAGLRARAAHLRNSIMLQLGGPDPGQVNAHIGDKQMDDTVQDISQREIFKRDKKCINCGMDAENQCAICHKVRYCGADCWRSDRDIHKSECKKE